MNKIDYRIPGTKIPKLSENTAFKALYWKSFQNGKTNPGYLIAINSNNMVSHGYIKELNEDCILIEVPDYTSNKHWVIKEQDLLKLTEDMNKQNNLPKYWVVKNTNNDDFKVVVDYINNNYTKHYEGKQINHYYGYDGSPGLNGITCCYYISGFINNPTLLTLEEFKKAINIEDNKKIIGYKVPYDMYDGKLKKETIVKQMVQPHMNKAYGIPYGNGFFEQNIFIPAEIVELWEPIYEEETKIVNMGSFSLTIKDRKVFHKNEDITDFVRNMQYYVMLQNLGRYTARIKDITFSSTGCETTETKLTDWLKVYDMIK